ncbi:MAG TPA: DUF5939 domain-containing protein, partial [Kofleriaceae bacterium]|nr:DUF5939 domain-containing protein [Kofleriaceae bacterium]
MPEPAPMGLDAFRKAHPWPAAYRGLGRPREWLWWFDVPASPEQVWSYVADTARLNRAARLAEMHYSERGGELHGWHRTAGLRHEFVERWQWVSPQRVELVREYRTGLARLLRVLNVIEPRGSGSRLYTYHGWIPRGPLGPLAVRVGMKVYEARYRSLIGKVAEAAGRLPPSALFREASRGVDVDRRRRMNELRSALRERGVDQDALDRLIDLAESGDELELDRIRVRRLARDWQMDERRVLIAALHATRAGLLELTWDIMCPHCRGVRAKLQNLGDVPERASCEPCAVEFGTDREN